MHTLQMNENQWKVANDLAFELIDNETDVNEFGKVVAFMRRYQNADNAIDTFRLLLQRLANSGSAFSRSNQTPQHYLDIKECCEKHLAGINDVEELMLILGWCRRLMYYYKEEPKRAVQEQRPPQQQQQRTQEPRPIKPLPLKEEVEKPKIKLGDKINATILKKESFNITVQLETDNNEEVVFVNPAYYTAIGTKVKMKVLAINDNGIVTKVTPG